MSRKVNGCIITIAHYSLSASKRNFHNAVLLNSFIEATITKDDSWQILWLYKLLWITHRNCFKYDIYSHTDTYRFLDFHISQLDYSVLFLDSGMKVQRQRKRKKGYFIAWYVQKHFFIHWPSLFSYFGQIPNELSTVCQNTFRTVLEHKRFVTNLQMSSWFHYKFK